MDGDIGVESSPGAGSTFWFTAEFDAPAQATALAGPPSGQLAPEEAIKARHPGAHILVAEDEPTNREVFRLLLEEAGLRVDMARDGVEAVEMSEQADYDLILMDIQMPRMDGLDATRAIRALSGRREVPILATTANVFREDRERCLAAGMDDHVGKPVDPAVLFATVLKWLERPRG